MTIPKGERFNTWTHLIGTVLALAGTAVLVVFASLQGDPWKIVSFSIYGLTLFLLYFASTLYHWHSGKFKVLFQRFDHLAIYLLIAGSYTPFSLVTLNGAWGWSLFGTIWLLALVGMIQETILKRKYEFISVIIYAIMGWLILIALGPLLENLTVAGFWWLFGGGMMYTLGIAFYAFDSKIKHFHGIWHLFVFAGSAAHFFTIIYFIL
jgi:hemolysin III